MAGITGAIVMYDRKSLSCAPAGTRTRGIEIFTRGVRRAVLGSNKGVYCLKEVIPYIGFVLYKKFKDKLSIFLFCLYHNLTNNQKL